MVLVYASFSQRKRIGARNWRRLHWATYGIFAAATVHGLAAGSDSRRPWAFAIYLAAVGSVAGATAWRALVPPPLRPRPPAVAAARAACLSGSGARGPGRRDDVRSGMHPWLNRCRGRARPARGRRGHPRELRVAPAHLGRAGSCRQAEPAVTRQRRQAPAHRPGRRRSCTVDGDDVSSSHGDATTEPSRRAPSSGEALTRALPSAAYRPANDHALSPTEETSHRARRIHDPRSPEAPPTARRAHPAALAEQSSRMPRRPRNRTAAARRQCASDGDDGRDPARARRARGPDARLAASTAPGPRLHRDAAHPPIALKLGSTGYRFARYYTGTGPTSCRAAAGSDARARAVRDRGHPRALRLGRRDARARADEGWIVNLHKASFIAWLGVTGVHVLGHVLHIPGLAGADFRAPRERRGVAAAARRGCGSARRGPRACDRDAAVRRALASGDRLAATGGEAGLVGVDQPAQALAISSGVGGQPGMRRSTGSTSSTDPTISAGSPRMPIPIAQSPSAATRRGSGIAS